jgi:hypothetical protein
MSVNSIPTTPYLDEMPLERLASLAAIELDNISLQKAGARHEAISALVRRLRTGVEIEAVGAHNALVDPSTAVMVSQALGSSRGTAPTTVEALVTEAQTILVGLERRPGDDLSELKSFCIALAHVAAARSEPFAPVSPSFDDDA